MILKLGAVWFQTTHPLVSAPQWHKHQNLTDLIDELLGTKFEKFVSWREKLLLCSWVCLGDLVRPKPLLKDPTIKYFSTFILFFVFYLQHITWPSNHTKYFAPATKINSMTDAHDIQNAIYSTGLVPDFGPSGKLPSGPSGVLLGAAL